MLAAIREQRRQARLLVLREGLVTILRDRPAASVWLFGSLARGDWDAFSDVDLLAVAPDQAQASALADDLLAAGLANDVLALDASRWQQLRSGDDPYWRAIGADAIRLDPP